MCENYMTKKFNEFFLRKSIDFLLVFFLSILLTACGGGTDSGNSISATATSTQQSLTVGTTMPSFTPLSPSGGSPPYIFSYTGALPDGLSFNSNTGVVKGIPTTIYATADLVFSVQDANHVTASTTSTISFTVGSVPNNPLTINDTGITANQCYQAGSDALVACSSDVAFALSSSQDGMIGRDGNATSNNNVDGMMGFSFTSVAGGCVLDNVTGLMWEVKTTDGGLRDKSNTFTYYGDNSAGEASTYQAAVNATNLCGFNDWRLPTVDELQGIVDYSIVYPGPLVDTNWFPNSPGGWFWSVTPFVSDTPTGFFSGVWGVNFYLGIASFGSDLYVPAFDTHPVRLVRAGKPLTSPRYSVSVSGDEVTDNQTNLIWKRCAEGMIYSGGTCTGIVSWFGHEAALLHAKAQANNAGVAWRLPNIKELTSIADKSNIKPSINSSAFPATPTSWFWSSSPYINCSCNSWGVDFTNGSISVRNRSNSNYVRLVRASQ